ncbi:hypothetical protein AC629_00825 [Bradyrhizobium sp. NAS80.1]|nr:hypothetical protein AC629_00825 [Bradyrhizobium sp. NAS80.1]
MRFAPVIALFGTACGLAAVYTAGSATITGAAGTAAAGVTRASESTKQLLAPGAREAPIFESDAPAFRYASIQRGSIEQTVTVTGALQPVKTIEVGSQLSGQLARVYVDFNDTVSKDQPLALIDPRSFAAKVDEAKAALEVANSLVDIERAKLDRARIDLQNAKGSRDVLAAKLESAQAVKASAQKTLQRKLALQSQNVVATSTVDDAQTEFTAHVAQEREAEVMVSLNAYSVDGAQADVRRIEQQRIAIARALIASPLIVLADEPTGALDSRTGAEILALFAALNQRGQTVVMITHDPGIATQCRRTIRLHDGEIVSDEARAPLLPKRSFAS